MSTTDDLAFSPDILPADAPLRGGKRAKSESAAASATVPAATPVAPASAGFDLTIHVGTPTPVVLTFPTKESRAKAVQQLIQRASKLPTTFTTGGVTTTFLYITHFTFSE